MLMLVIIWIVCLIMGKVLCLYATVNSEAVAWRKKPLAMETETFLTEQTLQIGKQVENNVLNLIIK